MNNAFILFTIKYSKYIMKPHIFGKGLDEIKKIIITNGDINQVKKVKFGEVFTPFELIIEMLDTLPVSIWRNPNNKWLDPGSGIGNFSMAVFYYLDKGLKKWESNDEKRRNHIIKNMIHMVEISGTNVNKCKKIFGNNANICKCDFIKDSSKWKEQFKNDRFNVILGNPPYNVNGMKGKGRTDTGGSVIWNKFVDNSLDIVASNGYCLFFTPNSWTELKSALAKKIITKQIVLFKNFDVVNAYKLFDKQAGSLPLCYYLIKNSAPNNKTLIHDMNSDKFVEFDINKYMIIPNKNINLIKKILTKNNDSLSEYFNFTPAKEKKDTNLYKSTYSPPYYYPLINYVHKKIYISYAKECSVVQNTRPKLILPNYSMGYPILDTKGVLDVGGRTSYYIELPDNNIEKLKKIQAFFMTDLALTIINSLKTAQKFLSTRTFEVFPDVTNFKFQINDESLAKYYNLNSEDKKSIVEQKQNGEGNLSNAQKEEMVKFSISNIINKTHIKLLDSKIRSCKHKTKRRRGCKANCNTRKNKK